MTSDMKEDLVFLSRDDESMNDTMNECEDVTASRG